MGRIRREGLGTLEIGVWPVRSITWAVLMSLDDTRDSLGVASRKSDSRIACIYAERFQVRLRGRITVVVIAPLTENSRLRPEA